MPGGAGEAPAPRDAVLLGAMATAPGGSPDSVEERRGLLLAHSRALLGDDLPDHVLERWSNAAVPNGGGEDAEEGVSAGSGEESEDDPDATELQRIHARVHHLTVVGEYRDE